MIGRKKFQGLYFTNCTFTTRAKNQSLKMGSFSEINEHCIIMCILNEI